MPEWSAGYVADIGYTYGTYSELNPQRLVLPFLLAGVRPPRVATGVAVPTPPPSPPTPSTSASLVARPEGPEAAVASAWPPELAIEDASAAAVAAPVSPESPLPPSEPFLRAQRGPGEAAHRAGSASLG